VHAQSTSSPALRFFKHTLQTRTPCCTPARTPLCTPASPLHTPAHDPARPHSVPTTCESDRKKRKDTHTDTDENEDKNKHKNDAGNAEVTGSRRESIKNVKARRQAYASSDPMTPRRRRLPEGGVVLVHGLHAQPTPHLLRLVLSSCSGSYSASPAHTPLTPLVHLFASNVFATQPRQRTRSNTPTGPFVLADQHDSASPRTSPAHVQSTRLMLVLQHTFVRLASVHAPAHAPLSASKNTSLHSGPGLALAHAPRLEPQGASQSNRKKER
jgi:hypothetical protein